jgi:hypothetical protein
VTPLSGPAQPLDRLNGAIIAAHEAGDGMRLACLYGEAADRFAEEAERYAAVLRRHGRL